MAAFELEDLLSSRAIDASAIALVVAHPDDETIGMGGQLHRMRGVTLIHATTGAPRDPAAATSRGFADRPAYEAARQRELDEAATAAGIPAEARIQLGLADQELSFGLAPLARRLADLLAARRVEAVFTHPYEGGHPDHDAISFAVHAACALIERGAGRPPRLFEMTFYHAGPAGIAFQRFAPEPVAAEILVPLDEAGRDARTRMISAHASQQRMLSQLVEPSERFRAAPDYDFTRPANDGRLLYAQRGITGEAFVERAREARRALNMGD